MQKVIKLQSRRILDLVDGWLDPITSYKLVLYVLIAIAGWAVFISAISHNFAYKWYDITLSALFLLAVCRAVNYILSWSLNVPRNAESDMISALILLLILSPAQSYNDFLILALAGAFAMASKYVIVFGQRHVFNPAASGAFLAGALFHHYASWWVGTAVLTPVVFIGGWLILRKMKRFTMVSAFIAIYLVVVAINVVSKQSVDLIWHNIWTVLVASPLLFFAYIMLTEPLTSPNKIEKYLPYSALVAVLYGVTRFRLSPEEALLFGNAFAYVMAPYKRLKLALASKRQEAAGIYSFGFKGKDKFKFQAGQYLEWTIPSAQSDGRGNRRYLTISSSPSEDELTFTVKIPQPASSFKQHIANMKKDELISATHLSGSFTLPKDRSQKMAFLAGGVGITPFRSIIKYLVDSKQARDIHLVYSASQANEFAFKQLFTQAGSVGVKTDYSTVKLDATAIKQTIPDFQQRVFYVSGPYGFVKYARQALINLGLPLRNIITDYFPGYG